MRKNERMEPEPEQPLTASQKFEEEARLWEETGKFQRSGQDRYAFLQLQCWLLSAGAKADGVSKRLKRYYKAADKRFGGQDWLDDFLRIRDNCSLCGASYRLENLSICTHCFISLGYCHQGEGGLAPNGNFRCPSCKVGEIVG